MSIFHRCNIWLVIWPVFSLIGTLRVKSYVMSEACYQNNVDLDIEEFIEMRTKTNVMNK